ncbi:hypothetical protein L6R29_01360 [Myxococcota bacterium]|nr:hypothetical protein [Myxococcota bacterium]
MKSLNHLPQPPSPTSSSHTSPFFHAQYLERSEHYAYAATFSISWLFLFGLLALGLGIAYWSLAAWETYFVNDPYYRELRDLTAIANATTALVVTLPPLILLQLLFHSTTPWVQRAQAYYGGLWVAWWLTLWIGMGLPFGGSAGTLSILSVAALLTLVDQRRNLLLNKQAPILGAIALLLAGLLSFPIFGALLWKAAPWLALLLGFIAMRTFPFKDDPRGIFVISALFVFSFGPWLTTHPRYTGFLSLARYNALDDSAAQHALRSLHTDHKHLPSLRFYAMLYPLTKSPSLRPQTTRLLLVHWSQNPNHRPFPTAFLRQHCTALDLPTLQKQLHDSILQKRLLTELFAYLRSPQTRDDARWLLLALQKSWPHHHHAFQTHLQPATFKPSPHLFPPPRIHASLKTALPSATSKPTSLKTALPSATSKPTTQRK